MRYTTYYPDFMLVGGHHGAGFIRAHAAIGPTMLSHVTLVSHRHS
jgi:hypothetical protein